MNFFFCFDFVHEFIREFLCEFLVELKRIHTKTILRMACTVIEYTPFLSLILKTNVKNFHPTPDVSLIMDFSGNQNKHLKFIVVHFLNYF